MNFIKFLLSFIFSSIFEIGFLFYGYFNHISWMMNISYSIYIFHAILSLMVCIVIFYDEHTNLPSDYPKYVELYKFKSEHHLKITDFAYNIIAGLALAFVGHFVWATIFTIILILQDELTYQFVERIKLRREE